MPKSTTMQCSESSWQHRLLGHFGRLVILLLLLVEQTEAWGVPKEDEFDPPVPFCIPEAFVEVEIRSDGLPVVGNEVRILATTAKVIVTEPGHKTSAGCQKTLHPINSFKWELFVRPSGSAATLTDTKTLSPKLKLDKAGEYKVRFVACPTKCMVPMNNGGHLPVPSTSRSLTITAVEELVFPPESEPVFPEMESTTRTPFPEADEKCNGGGGFIDPQWVTVNPWHGPQDYELLEGRVRASRISRMDNPLNHDSQDFLTHVVPDPPFRRLLALTPKAQNDVEVEWERAHFPEVFRPTRGDRVSIVGYWIHDCGHGSKTEIHPPVMVATHRSRPVKIPSSAGHGSNVYVPGVVTHLWLNQYAGEITGNCSSTGLHQPDSGSKWCLPQSEGYHHNPINRVYEFNIYLPRDPQAVMAEAGFPAPSVPLYTEILDPFGGAGPDPTIKTVKQGDVTFLKVRLDLSSYTGATYSRKIVAAWAHIAPDNWGLKRWKLRINSMDVHDDGDNWPKGDGDWRFWANTNNTNQEWTKLFDGDGNVHGLMDFGGQPWETGSPNPNRSLGPDILVFPRQDIWVHTSGFEDDWIVSDDTGSVDRLWPQLQRSYSTRCQCSSDGISYCADYTLNYEILTAGSVGRATLSEKARARYAAYTIRFDENRTVIARLPSPIERIWNLPERLELLPGSQAISLDDTSFFPQQHTETSALTGISIERLREVLSARRDENPRQVSRALQELREEADQVLKSGRRTDAINDLSVLRAALPADLWKRYFGDLGCDLETNVRFPSRSRQESKNEPSSVPCCR